MFIWILRLQVVPVYIELGLGVGADEDGGLVVRDRIPTLVQVQRERPQVLAEVKVFLARKERWTFWIFYGSDEYFGENTLQEGFVSCRQTYEGWGRK